MSDYAQKKSRMICWPTNITIGVNTKHLIRQLLHYRARFRPKYSDLEVSPFFVDGMPPGCWDLVAARHFIVRLSPFSPRAVWDISVRVAVCTDVLSSLLASIPSRRIQSGGCQAHSTAAAAK